VGAFELQDTEYAPTDTPGERAQEHARGKKKIKEEFIIALKIYDSCRRQNCLTPAELGPARAAESGDLCDEPLREGEIIRPPHNAASVTVDHLRIARIVVVDKRPNPFKNGFWDVDVKFVFAFDVTFRETDGCLIAKTKGTNLFNMKVSLFGSTGSDLVVGTDLFKAFAESATFEAEPFIWVEAKAVALDAKIHHVYGDLPYQDPHGPHDPHRPPHNEVLVTLGLFSIIKLFRLVHLGVESRGFGVPEECENSVFPDVSPCEYSRWIFSRRRKNRNLWRASAAIFRIKKH